MTEPRVSIRDEGSLVKVVYDYSYFSSNDQKNLTFRTGEEYYLIAKTSESWWYVKKRPEDNEGYYVPAQYVEELGEGGEGGSVRVPPATAPVSERRPELELVSSSTSPKLSKSQVDVAHRMPSVSVDELNNILGALNVPEEFQDDDQTRVDAANVAPSLDAKDDPPSSPRPVVEPTDVESPEQRTVPEKGSNQNSRDEIRVESETSDYKTDSRESLDSEGRGFEAGEDPGSAKAVEEAKTPGCSSSACNVSAFGRGIRDAPKRPLDRNISPDSPNDYANLEEIRKAIHSRNTINKQAPPLADNLLPPGYSRPYQTPSSKVEMKPPTPLPPEVSSDSFGKAVLDRSSSREIAREAEDFDSRLSVAVPTPSTKRRSMFSLKKSQSTGIQLVKFTNTPSTPPSAHQQSPPLQTPPESSTPSFSSGGQEDHSGRTSELILQPKMVEKQGPLQKAKVEENSKKMKKSWSQSYAVLCQHQLYFYKDMKSSSAKPRSISSLGKPEGVVDLNGAKITPAPEDKNVKKDAFMLITKTKTHFLLHHDDEENNQHWRQSIQNNISVLESGVVPDSTGSLLKVKPDISSSHDILESKQTIADRLKNFLLRRPSKEAIKKKGIYKEVMFGSSLISICEREKEKVPRFVKECILAVEGRGLKVDGLYRVSGNVASVQKLRSMVDHNEYYDLNHPSWDIHTITGALKLFFRELSEPLFTFKLFQPFLASINNVNAVKDLTKQLPVQHYKTMKLLFKHFTLVLQHGRENRMQVQSIAIVFGPTLLWPENASKDSNLAFSLVQQGQLVEFIINNFKAIFG